MHNILFKVLIVVTRNNKLSVFFIHSLASVSVIIIMHLYMTLIIQSCCLLLYYRLYANKTEDLINESLPGICVTLIPQR